MKRFLASIVAVAFLAVAPASASPAAGMQDHEANWLIALGPPGLPGSGGCYGDLIVAPALEGDEGIWYARMDVDPDTWDAPFTVTFRTETGRSSHYLMGVVGVSFYDADGERLGSATAGGYERILGDDRIAQGSVPHATTTAIFWTCEDLGPFAAMYHAGSDA